MKEKKDNLLLENLYQEGIWDRLKGQGAGIKAGASTLGQGLKNKAISALGGTPTKEPSNTAGQSYAKAQQSSLLKSFQSKIKKEIDDFKNDLKKFKVDPDEKDFSTTFPTIAQKLQELDKLEKFLQNPTSEATPTDAPEATSEATPTDAPEATSEATPTDAPEATSEATPTDAPEATSEATPTAEATPEPTKDVLNSDEASSYLGISKEELFKKVQTGEIPGIKLGTKGYIFPKQNIIKAKQNVSSTPTPTPTGETTPEEKPALGSTPQEQPKGNVEKQVVLDTDLNTTYQFINNQWYPRTGSKKDGFNYGEPIQDKNLIKQLETEHSKEEQQLQTPEDSSPTTKAPVAKAPVTKKPITKVPATKKPLGKTKPVEKFPSKIPGSVVQARRAGNIPPAKFNALQRTSESYNPFGEFLKENNLI